MLKTLLTLGNRKARFPLLSLNRSVAVEINPTEGRLHNPTEGRLGNPTEGRPENDIKALPARGQRKYNKRGCTVAVQ